MCLKQSSHKQTIVQSSAKHLLFFVFLLVIFSSPFKAHCQTEHISATARNRVLAAYHLLKDSLLTQAPQPFIIHTNRYSLPFFEEVRQQIFKGNLAQVRFVVLQALGSETVMTNPQLYVAAQSVWMEYLANTDSLEQAYQEGVKLVRYADSLKVPNISLAYIATGKAGCTLEQYYSYSAVCAGKALSIARQNGDKALEAKARLIIALLARGLFWGTSGRSIPHYDKTIEAAIAGKDTATLIRTLYLKHSDIDKPGDTAIAIPCIEQAIQLAIRSNNLLMVSRLCLELGLNLDAIGEKNKCTELLLAALPYAKKLRTRLMELHLRIQLSDVYTERKQYDSALYYVDQWKATDPLDPGRKTLLLIKAQLYYNMGRYKEAATLYQENSRERENAYMLHGQNVLSQWEATIRMQDKEIELQQDTAKRKQLIWIISAVVVVLAITLLAMLWQRSLRRRLASQNLFISRQSAKLQQSLQEKEMLLKEIHHRVKNNLQVIDSLLDMHQADILQQGQAEEAFTKARTQVHTIAMIHQNLYQQHEVSAVDMHTFINALFAQTEQLFNKHHKIYTFNNQIKDVYFDIDTAAPLGLIMNELLTNAFKYVLPMNENMAISVNITTGTQPEQYVLQCHDNGTGLPNGKLPAEGRAMGLQLVTQLARQIGGRLNYSYIGGSCFTIVFLTLKGRKEMD